MNKASKVCSNDEQVVAKFINAVTAAVGVCMLGCHIGHTVKMHYFILKIFFSTPGCRSDKLSTYKVMMDKEGSTKVMISISIG